MKIKEMDLLEQFRRFWEWLVGIQHWNTLEGWIARVFVWIVCAYILLFVLKHILEMVAKIAESWKTLGFEVRQSPEKLARLRRRQQFGKVLLADLATLAKAESWNDQFFTDLEAEVEAEGDYYASRVDRLLRRKSNGLRRVPSLIQAIESSTEQCLLVTGDPGSGKSVALRHLANQLAERASRSKSLTDKIPLYLNLKELPPPPPEGPSADFIKEFVLENIRRGDADTAAYVRENWSIHREQGLWFFLFDSFDEIPAVLHAPTGSPAIRQHADAIRQFFEGMSACQGVLASREFKGPDALPWKRFRILALSPSRQDELIENSFLSPDLRGIAVQHVAASEAGFLTNPLFLTLLCRYIKEERKPPMNDNELLLKHVYRLAHREPDYVRQRYGLQPDQLIEGSISLSVLFAEQSSLSLAPTQDQISQALSGHRLPGGDLEKLLAALIDVKIGRCDVKEARAGDRRFTFAHRRYQETLFVQHLVNNPSHIPANTLLTDLRWRDYTVTLLQTSPHDVITPLLNEAGLILDNLAKVDSGIPVLPTYGVGICYYEWKVSAGAQLLRTLQEGLSRRLELVPQKLRESIKSFLDTPWKNGDAFDRVMTISLGGLLPETDLHEKIEWAVNSGAVPHWDAAVSSSSFLSKVPEGTARWLRHQLANRLLFASQRADVVRQEAIAERLPPNIGAMWIVKRLRVIRPLFRVVNLLVRFPLSSQSRFPKTRFPMLDAQIVAMGFNIVAILLVPILLAGGLLFEVTKLGSILLIAIGVCGFVYMLRFLVVFVFRATGDQLSVKSIATEFSHMRSKLLSGASGTLKQFIILAAAFGLIGGISHLIAWAASYKGDVATLYIFSPLSVFMLVGVCGFVSILFRSRLSLVNLRQAKLKVDRPALVLRAASWAEVDRWLASNVIELIPSSADARSFLRFIEAVDQGLKPLNGVTRLEDKNVPDEFDPKNSINLVIPRLVELESEGQAKA